MGRHDRLHSSATDDQRDPFQRDRDRILYSEALRRLQGVTQVVSADEGVVVHNRLTHSLKVAQVARRIADKPSVLRREPNLQYFPIRTELGKQIKEAFAPKLPVFEIDYSAIEFKLLQRIKNREDV